MELSLADPSVWASLLTLAALEIVLGIDNVIFISIVSSRLPEAQRQKARTIGLTLALVMRIILLLGISWIIGLTEPVFSILEHHVSWRDLIMLGGGLFLLAKGTMEIHHSMEGEGDEDGSGGKTVSLAAVIIQITLLDVVFSIDSVVTAVGMADHVEIMIAAVIIAMAVMFFASGPVGDFVSRHPTTRMLALSFLLLVGVVLIADGLHFHVPRGYLYFAIAFSMFVEFLNLARMKRRKKAKAAATRS